MSIEAVALLLISSLLATAGQVMLKYSTVGRATLGEHLNPWLLAGLGCYATGAVLWIYCLARLPLLRVYPFTALAFILTILAGVVVFGEQVAPTYWVGLGFIFAGLFLVSL